MCRPVTELAPREPRPYLYLTDVYLGDGDEDKALPTLARAEELLAGAADPEAWQLLALTLEKARLPTLAARAAGHADPATAADVERWASALRRQMALPLDAARARRGAGGRSEIHPRGRVGARRLWHAAGELGDPRCRRRVRRRRPRRVLRREAAAAHRHGRR